MSIEAALPMAREFSGLSVVQIAIASRLAVAQVIAFEIGESRLSSGELTRLARAIRIRGQGPLRTVEEAAAPEDREGACEESPITGTGAKGSHGA